MGTFAWVSGDAKIPEAKKEEFKERITEIFYRGGMMRTEWMRMFDKSIKLLVPAETDEAGQIVVDYNYLENSFWEAAVFDTNTCEIWSSKVGWAQFEKTMAAAYMLYELYAQGDTLAVVCGSPMPVENSVRWINGLFHENYTLERRMDLWKLLCRVRKLEEGRAVTWDMMEEHMPEHGVNWAWKGFYEYVAVQEKITKLRKEKKEIAMVNTSVYLNWRMRKSLSLHD